MKSVFCLLILAMFSSCEEQKQPEKKSTSRPSEESEGLPSFLTAETSQTVSRDETTFARVKGFEIEIPSDALNHTKHNSLRVNLRRIQGAMLHPLDPILIEGTKDIVLVEIVDGETDEIIPQAEVTAPMTIRQELSNVADGSQVKALLAIPATSNTVLESLKTESDLEFYSKRYVVENSYITTTEGGLELAGSLLTASYSSLWFSGAVVAFTSKSVESDDYYVLDDKSISILRGKKTVLSRSSKTSQSSGSTTGDNTTGGADSNTTSGTGSTSAGSDTGTSSHTLFYTPNPFSLINQNLGPEGLNRKCADVVSEDPSNYSGNVKAIVSGNTIVIKGPIYNIDGDLVAADEAQFKGTWSAGVSTQGSISIHFFTGLNLDLSPSDEGDCNQWSPTFYHTGDTISWVSTSTLPFRFSGTTDVTCAEVTPNVRVLCIDGQ